MQWPSPNSLGVVRLTISPPSSSGRSGITMEGPWAWFRLLDQSDLTQGNAPDRFTLRMRVDNASISSELRASSAFNPFRSRVVTGFGLPERLTTAGFYGKLASRGDFIHRGLPPAFIEAWDQWLAAGMAQSQAELAAPGWTPTW